MKDDPTKPPTKEEIAVYERAVEALSTELPLEGPLAALPCRSCKGTGRATAWILNLNAPTPPPDPRIKISTKRGLCVLHFAQPYEIDLDRVNNETELLSWAYHLAGKPWMDCSRLKHVIRAIAEAKGLKYRIAC